MTLIASTPYPEHFNAVMDVVRDVAFKYNWSCKIQCVDRIESRRRSGYMLSFYTPGVFIVTATQMKMAKDIVDALSEFPEFQGKIDTPTFVASRGDKFKNHSDYHRLQLPIMH